MSDKFLAQVATHVLSKMGNDLGETLIVLPSQRAAVYLRKHLVEKTDKVRFAPDILTLDQFITQFSPVKNADRIDLLFSLYESYLDIWKSSAEPLDSFLKWAPMALKDFNEIDAYLVDRNQIFRDLTNLKELDEWSLNEDVLTDNQKQYAWFWKKLGELYFQFTNKLQTSKAGYQGLVFRAAAEDVKQSFRDLKYKRIYFCGFNALSRSEEQIIAYLQSSGIAEILWDADRFYLDYPGHEAGHFLRKNFELFKDSKQFIHSELTRTEKSISIYAAPNEVSQCDIMATLLAKNNEQAETAIVLGNENLLSAVLNTLPNNVTQTNVTMGLKVSNAPLHNLFKVLFNIQTSRNANGDFHYRQIQELLNQAYFNLNRKLITSIAKIQGKIVKENLIYIHPETLIQLDENLSISPLIKAISIRDNSALAQWQMQKDVLQFIIESLPEAGYKVEKEYLFHYLKVLRRIGQILERKHEYFTAAAYSRIFLTLAASENLNFVGEPLEGLQVMGMLETRTLDFKNIILLSCNEEVLPGNKHDQSLIPFELKKFYQLPTRSEHDAIFAYHFYRLLQRAENVHLIYNTSGNDWQNAEPSRYIAQLEYDFAEIPGITINRSVSAIKQDEFKQASSTIVKSEFVLNQIKSLVQGQLSPSAINGFILCPLNFYYQYIIGYRKDQQVEENIEYSTLGTVVHNVLEEMYKPFVKQGVLKVEPIIECQKVVRTKVIEEFKKFFPHGGIDTGNNRLILEVAVKFVDRFLEKEIEEIKNLATENQYIQILALEEKMNREITVSTAIGPITAKIGGKADRIDKIGNKIRIIDYKTGKVESGKLNVADSEKLESKATMAKALQLLTYAWLYAPQLKTDEVLEASIISFQNMTEFNRPASWEGESQLNPIILKEFETSLSAIIERMFDKEIPIAHNTDSTWCVFCKSTVEEE